MSTQEDKLVQQMAAPIIAQHKKATKWTGKNLRSRKRMNRPCQAAKMEKGHEFILGFLKRAGV